MSNKEEESKRRAVETLLNRPYLFIFSYEGSNVLLFASPEKKNGLKTNRMNIQLYIEDKETLLNKKLRITVDLLKLRLY